LLRRTDVIVASPPYVPTAEIPLLPSEARHFEPLTALDGGANGLQIVARIARGASRWLAPGGCLALEVGTSQVDALADLLGHLGYGVRTATSEEYGSAVVVGRT
jgi:release factor glutamine methyltransferase